MLIITAHDLSRVNSERRKLVLLQLQNTPFSQFIHDFRKTLNLWKNIEYCIKSTVKCIFVENNYFN